MKPLHRYLALLPLFLSVCQGAFWDRYHLSKAYTSYHQGAYSRTLSQLKKIETPSLESQIILGDTLYRQGEYQEAISHYQSIHSTSVAIKQHLYYNIANAYVKLSQYSNAKRYYAKVLQLGIDDDAMYNLQLIALKEDKKKDALGIANPKSQNGDSSKSENKEGKEKTRDENKPSSGSGGEGEASQEKNQKKGKLMSSHKEEQHPLGSKVYELINEGYIYEQQPW